MKITGIKSEWAISKVRHLKQLYEVQYMCKTIYIYIRLYIYLSISIYLNIYIEIPLCCPTNSAGASACTPCAAGSFNGVYIYIYIFAVSLSPCVRACVCVIWHTSARTRNYTQRIISSSVAHAALQELYLISIRLERPIIIHPHICFANIDCYNDFYAISNNASSSGCISLTYFDIHFSSSYSGVPAFYLLLPLTLLTLLGLQKLFLVNTEIFK